MRSYSRESKTHLPRSLSLFFRVYILSEIAHGANPGGGDRVISALDRLYEVCDSLRRADDVTSIPAQTG